MNAIEMKQVCRSFGTGKNATLAVDRLSLAVPQGSVFGLLGANGAGKTTSIRMLVSHLRPDSGEIRVLGEDPVKQDESLRRRVAYISENMQIPRWMSIADAVRFCRPLYPEWNDALLEQLLKRFDLKIDKQYDEASKGQRRAMCIIVALCQNPDVLIMDEPASGLDTLARRHFLTEVLNVACEGNKTVLFSSHILGDIERTVDRVAIMTKGRLILGGELDALKESVRRITFRSERLDDLPKNVFQKLRVLQEKDNIQWIVTDFDEEKMRKLHEALPRDRTVDVEVDGFNLEGLFMESIQSEPTA